MDRKYVLDTEENREFLKTAAEGLLEFGKQFPSPGGASYYLGDDGTPWKDRPRETWITCRMVHSYSIGDALGFPGSGELIDAGLKGLLGELRDTEHGGFYSGRTADGGILPEKQCYAHAFVILAGTSALLAGKKEAEALLKIAFRDYDRFFWDEDLGLARDTWDTDFTVCSPYRGINANMHSTEAFLAAADALGKEEYRERAGRIVRHVIGWAADNGWRIPEHFTEDWAAALEFNREKPDDPFKPFGATPGHGLEWARLITQWALSTYHGDKKLAAPFTEAAEELYQRAVLDGWGEGGAPGFCYTTGWDGKAIVRDRMHWTLAEGINTAAVLYRVTGKERYKDDFAAYMDYLDHVVMDHEHGSWFHQMAPDGRVLTTVWPGKSDIYHALQAMLIPYCPAEVSVAKAVRIR